MDHWVMDYETMVNCFVAVFEHYKTDETKVFVIHELRNDFDEFAEFLQQNIDNGERHISFNGLAFDAQITEYFLKYKKQWGKFPASRTANEIYQKAQFVIDKSNKREWLDYYEAKMKIPQIDLFKLNHWDNPAKRSSLKWIQFSMDWHNLQDMPIHHSTPIHTQEELDQIIGYCINDVQSTKAILDLSKGQINLRNDLTQQYDINLFSASEPKISKELFLYYLAQETGLSKKEIKYSRTHRKTILGKNIILPYIKFTTPAFQELYNIFNDAVIDPLRTKGGLKHTIKDNGVKIDFGLGGVHGCRESGVYEATEGMTILSSDVKSYYPNLGIKNGWSPAHLPQKIFCELYEWFYNERVKIPKSNIMNYVYKIILNSTYGLSNDKHSFLYDPQFTMQITINGQLSLMMLYERIVEEIPGAMPLMQNTDGVETMIPTEHIDQYMQICKDWEEITNLELEHDEYKKLILADVNSYIAVYKNGKTKCKGRFEFDGLALHKNKSHLVVAKALYEFFVNDTSPEAYLASNKNIFDYCIGKKIKGNWKFVKRYIEKDFYNPNTPLSEKLKCIREYGFYETAKDFWRTPEMQGNMAGAPTEEAYRIARSAEIRANPGGYYREEDIQPTIRYYISKTGSKIVKVNKSDARQIQVESGKWMQKVFNNYEKKDWTDYGVDESYYLKLIYKEIENIAGARLKQLTMF